MFKKPKFFLILIYGFRAKFVGFFPPISDLYGGLFIVNNRDEENTLNEEFDFTTFSNQFTIRLWTAIISFTILISICKSMIMISFQKLKFFDMTAFLWTSFIANLGGKPNIFPSLDSRKSYKIVVFISLLCGTMTWISYRARMNAVLSIRSKPLPFTDLDSMAETDWK